MLESLTAIDVEREACRRSLAVFVREAWPVLEPGTPYIDGWHVHAICEHLEAITDGELIRLLINIPPGTMKSTLTSVFWPAWEWGPRDLPFYRYLNASHEEGLATRDTLKMRRLITSDWYQARWPLRLTSDQNEKKYFENEATGFRQASAVGSMTGKRGHRVIWDDPHSVEMAHSPKRLAIAERVLRETLPTRFVDPERSASVVVMQRLNEKDVSGVILAEDFGYEHLCLPMEFEPDRRCVTSIGFKDPRTKEGELLFPERFPAHTVERDKKQLGSYATAGQLQQRPAPAGGGIFKAEWWRYYREVPKLLWRAIYADTAQKTKEENDYSVLQCWGCTYDHRAILLDQIRGKWESPELKRNARAFWGKHRAIKAPGMGSLRSMDVEDKVSGTGLIQDLKREGIPIRGIQRGTDKLTRMHDGAPFVEAGLVLLPESAPWLSDFLTEFEAAPNGTHDDQIDPALDAWVAVGDARGHDYGALL